MGVHLGQQVLTHRSQRIMSVNEKLGANSSPGEGFPATEVSTRENGSKSRQSCLWGVDPAGEKSQGRERLFFH